MKNKPLIAIISGSANDAQVIRPVLEQFSSFPVRLTYYVASAHRSAQKLKGLVQKLESEQARVFIGVAGYAAHLPGVIASLTQVPVYGVPLSTSELRGVDALYSVVMMPGGIPVATFGLGSSGLKNAILMACAHLAWEFPEIQDRLRKERHTQAERVSTAAPLWTNQ